MKLYDLSVGENRINIFCHRSVIVTIFENEGGDFDELSISIEELEFHIEKLKEELCALTNFINPFFEFNDNFRYALCSYEINSYLLGDVKFLGECDTKLLTRFPIVYIKKRKTF